MGPRSTPPPMSQDALYQVFLTDGLYQKVALEAERKNPIWGHVLQAFIFLYLPLFLTNAVANQDLGLRPLAARPLLVITLPIRSVQSVQSMQCVHPGRGLQFLVELYTKLVNHRCLNQEAFTVKVDISSLASLAKEIDDVRLLSGLAAWHRVPFCSCSSRPSRFKALSLREMPGLCSHREARPRRDGAPYC